jgi:hypothetical protein
MLLYIKSLSNTQIALFNFEKVLKDFMKKYSKNEVLAHKRMTLTS